MLPSSYKVQESWWEEHHEDVKALWSSLSWMKAINIELSLKAFSPSILNIEVILKVVPMSFSLTCNSNVFAYLCGCCGRYIKTSGNATVDHLSKYLAVRLALEELRSKGESNQMNLDTASEKQYTIYIATANGQFTVRTASKSKTEHRDIFDTDSITIPSAALLRWLRGKIHSTRGFI